MQFIAIFVLVLLPWLNPFAPGPSPYIVPWLVTLSAATGLAFLVSMYSTAMGRCDRGGTTQSLLMSINGAWLIAGLVSSAIGLLQYFDSTLPFGLWINQTLPGEAFANLRQRNQFASLTNIALAALIWFAVKLSSFPDVPIQTEKRRLVLLLLAAGLLVTAPQRLRRVQGLCNCFCCWRFVVFGGCGACVRFAVC